MAPPCLHHLRHHTLSTGSVHLRNLFTSPNPPQYSPKTPIPSIRKQHLFTLQLSPNPKTTHICSTLHNNQGDETQQPEISAQDAIKQYLEQHGALAEDALHICRNCPNYSNMLIEAVKEMDEWNSWNGEITGDAPEFKNKLLEMAGQKGDNGLLPFLESIGLSLSSATHLARFLLGSSSNELPVLIQKVKFMKEILLSGSDDQKLIGKNACRMMAHLSISADEDVQHTLAFFEKIQARRGGLNLLGSDDTTLRYLVESFPRLLYLPLQSRVPPILKFLVDIGVPEGNLKNILLLYPPVMLYDMEKDTKRRLKLFEKIGAKDNDLGKMLVKYPWILSTSVLENFEKVLDFFDELKVPKLCSSRAIKAWPYILGSSVNKLQVMVEQFDDMGIRDKKLGHVIATSPQLLLRKPQEFLQVVSFFKDSGLNDEEIARTICRCPEIFAASIEKTLKNKLEFLTTLGISKTRLPRVVRKYPELFVCDVNKALLPRMRYLMNTGLTRRDIGSMLHRFSPLLGYSIDQVLRPKLEFLVNTMGKPVSDVVGYPRYFSYSLEKKIKPRYYVMKARNKEFTLEEMLRKNDEEFAAEYLDSGDMLLVVPPS